MSRLGLELGPKTLRAVRVEGGARRTFEVDWEPDSPGDAVADLIATLGGAGSIGIAIHTVLLRVRRLELPPLPVGERRKALALESDRYFATTEPLVFSLPGDQGLTFAVSEARLEAWQAALRELGPVGWIEPAPAALARGLRDAGSPDGDLLRVGGSGVEWSRYREGRLVDARHVFGSLSDALAELPTDDPTPTWVEPWPEDGGGLPGVEGVAPMPAPDGLPARFAAAYGTALGSQEEWADGFVTEGLERARSRQRTRRTAGVVVALLAATVFAILSWDAYRERVDRRLDGEITELRAAAAPVMALEENVATLQRSLAALDRIEASRTDVLASLRALTNVVPVDTWLRTIHVSGDEWQIQGVGNDAAALIPLLDQHPRFQDVDFAAATRRVQTDNTTYDDFALAFRTTGPTEQP